MLRKLLGWLFAFLYTGFLPQASSSRAARETIPLQVHTSHTKASVFAHDARANYTSASKELLLMLFYCTLDLPCIWTSAERSLALKDVSKFEE
jgi:hypothetical protein